MNPEPSATVDSCGPPPPIRTRARLAAGLLALSMSLLGLWMSIDLRRYGCEHAFHHDIDSPVLAVELASNAAELKSAIEPTCSDQPEASRLAAQHQAKSALLRNTVADCFFIPLYTLFVWSFGSLFAVRAGGVRMRLRHMLAGVTIGTALADYVENVGIFRSLGLEPSDVLAQLTCWPSRCKWTLLATALWLTAVILFRSEHQMYSLPTRRLFGVGYVVSGALLVAGLWRPVLIELALRLFAVIVVLQIFALLGPYVADWIPADSPTYEEDFCDRHKKQHVDLAVHE